MFRWNDVEDKELFGMTVKMYRDPFESSNTVPSIFKGIEMDHQAYKYLGSELYMYRVLDVNFENFMEERGDVLRMSKVSIPAQQNTEITTF
jgi:hypothetical protein